MIYGIVCAAKDWGIGKNNGLLFNLKKDMEFFKYRTANSIVCMGENTLLSLPKSKPLKGRVNVVLCQEGHEYKDCICFHDFNLMLNFIKVTAKIFEVFIIGGAMFYKSMLPYYDQIFVTQVDATDPETTAFFPNLDNEPSYQVTMMTPDMEENGTIFRFMEYTKVKATK